MIQPTIYIKFSEIKVFDNETLNVFFNQLFTLLINNLNPELVYSQLMIDGEVSLLLQDEPAGDISKISMTTASQEIFNFLKLSAWSLTISKAEFFEKQILLKFDKTIISITYDETATETVDYYGISLREKNNIILK